MDVCRETEGRAGEIGEQYNALHSLLPSMYASLVCVCGFSHLPSLCMIVVSMKCRPGKVSVCSSNMCVIKSAKEKCE